MKIKRLKYQFILTYKLTDFDQIDVEYDLYKHYKHYKHYKKYIKEANSTARFEETGSGCCLTGDRDISYELTYCSGSSFNLNLLFKNMKRYLHRRGFSKKTTKISKYIEEDNDC